VLNLEFEFAAQAGKMDHNYMVNAVPKAWKKMTPAARQEAPARRQASGRPPSPQRPLPEPSIA
jgi:hypothetical protein